MVPETWSQVALDILAQKYFRRAGVAAALKKVEEEGVPEWLWRSVPDEEGPRRTARRASRYGGETELPPGVPPPRGLLDLLGLEGRLLLLRRRRPTSTMRCASCSPPSAPRPTPRSGSTPASTGHTASQGPPRATTTSTTPRASCRKSSTAYERPQPHACFIQSVRRRPGQPRRHHGPVGPRSPHLQVRLGHRLQLLQRARRERGAVRRRQIVAA